MKCCHSKQESTEAAERAKMRMMLLAFRFHSAAKWPICLSEAISRNPPMVLTREPQAME